MNWVLFSSGAREQYLENDVRALALLPGMDIQFRYEVDIVCQAFQDAVTQGNFKGQVAYIAYLDNRQVGADPTFVLLREVTIDAVEVRGSSYILKLIANRYILRPSHKVDKALSEERNNELRYDRLHEIEQTIVRPAIKAEMPAPDGNGFKNCWVCQMPIRLPDDKLVVHDSKRSAHLIAFELTCNALELHAADFDNVKRKLFMNIIDVVDMSGISVAIPRRMLKAGQEYRLILYHYYREMGSHAKWPDYWLESRANSDKLTFRTPQSIKIESEYDQKELVFGLDPGMDSGAAGFEIDLIANVGKDDAEKRATVLTVFFDFSARARDFMRWLRVVSIAVGLCIAQFTTLAFDKKITFDLKSVGALILIFAACMLAGFCAVFKDFKKSV